MLMIIKRHYIYKHLRLRCRHDNVKDISDIVTPDLFTIYTFASQIPSL